MGAVPAGGNVWKTIIIGVVTTVAAYVIVNFIFANKGQKEGFKKKKEATISAWKAIVKSNEFYLDDYYGAFCAKTEEAIVKGLYRAIDKQISDYQLMQKKPDIDDDLGLYINRFLDRGEDLKKLIQEYYDVVLKIEKDSTLPEEVRKTRLKEVETTYMPRFLALPTQDSSRINILHTELTKKYGDHFKALEKPIVAEKDIIGRWGDGNNNSFRFDGDHYLLMTVNYIDYTGKWRLDKNVLTMDFDDKSNAVYYIIYYGPDYLRFTVSGANDERQLCRQ